ncbi:MAG: hypothetical protein ABR987_08355 [Terracidiphilus sp.]
MHTDTSGPANAFAAKGRPFGKETDSPSALIAESLGVTTGFLKAIDFEITAARNLSGVWQAEPEGHVYMVRTLERMSEHLRALQAIQAAIFEAGLQPRL